MIVEIEVVRTEIVRDVEIGEAVTVQVAGADSEAEMRLRHPRHFREARAVVVKQKIQAAVRGVVPALVHEVQHAPIAVERRLRQIEDVERRRLCVPGQVRRQAVGNVEIDAAVAIEIEERRGDRRAVVRQPDLIADVDELRPPGRRQCVLQQTAPSVRARQQQRLRAAVVVVDEERAGDEAVGLRMIRDLAQRRQIDALKMIVAHVAIERVPIRRPLERIGDEEVGQAVVVEVAHRHGVAHRHDPLREMPHARIGSAEDIAHLRVDAGDRLRHLDEREPGIVDRQPRMNHAGVGGVAHESNGGHDGEPHRVLR